MGKLFVNFGNLTGFFGGQILFEILKIFHVNVREFVWLLGKVDLVFSKNVSMEVCGKNICKFGETDKKFGENIL